MSLTLDQRGMPILIGGLTMSEEQLRKTPRTVIHGKGGEEQLQILVTKAVLPSLAKEESEDDPTPLGGTVMDVISSAPQKRQGPHWVPSPGSPSHNPLHPPRHPEGTTKDRTKVPQTQKFPRRRSHGRGHPTCLFCQRTCKLAGLTGLIMPT